jgi:alkylation response protein AidB-like acyl-CoA dehydrogenase
MYDLHLSAEQRDIRDTVRDFVAREVKPKALAPARLEARARRLLADVLDEAAQLGLRALALSEDAGGAGADTLTCCIVTEEIAAGDPDIAAVLAHTSSLARALFDHAMTPQQRARFLPAFLADDHYHLALAEHEPDGGTALGIDYHRPRTSAARSESAAVRTNAGWVINGRKHRVANAPLAKLFAVELSIDTGGTGTLLVPRDAPGLTVKDGEGGMRRQHGAYGELEFGDCRVPLDNLLGADGRNALAADAGRRITQAAALDLGIGRAAYEAALDYAQLRVQGGRRIIEHQAIGTKLAEIAIRLEVARAAIWQAAWACDHPDAVADRSLPDLPLADISHVFATEAIYRATKDAAECFGAMGVMRDMPLQQYVHDALVCLNAGGGNNEAKLRIAEALAGYRRPAASPALVPPNPKFAHVVLQKRLRTSGSKGALES